MRKVNLTGGKALKLIVTMVCLCVVIGMLAANSLKVLSVAKYGNSTPVISSGNSSGGNSGSGSGSGNGQNSTGGGNNSGGNNSSGNNSGGIGNISGALPTTPDNSSNSSSDEGSSATQEPTQAPTESTDTPTSAPSDDTPTQTPTQKPTEPATDSPEVKKEKALILGEYKTIVNANNALAYGFTKSQYRTLEKTNYTSIFLASRFESKCPDYIIPESSPKVTAVAAGNVKNMVDFCIPYESAACFADTSKASEMLKSATKTTDEDGVVTITLVLRDETDPVVKDEETGKPASYTSSMFDIITKEEFTEMANKASLFETTDIGMTYSDCTVVLKYKPLKLTQKYEIVSLTQTVNYTASVSDGIVDGWNSVLGSFVPLSKGVTVTEVTEYSSFTTVIDEILK